VSTVVQSFVDGAVADALDRLAGPLPMSVCSPDPARPLPELVDWARDNGLRQVVTPYAPTGPAAEALSDLSDRLAGHGIALIPALRQWDAIAWPHATHGFFRFRDKIAQIWRAVQPSGSAPS
jgi:deoxyribodipyrimidine photo-lyase